MQSNEPVLELKDLRLVQAIEEQGGVGRAATHLALSQSAISHHLARVEARLGVPLFSRQGRSLQITAAGRRLVRLSHEVNRRVLEVERALRPSRGPRRVRLSTECYTGYHWLPELLAAVGEEHPDVRIDIVVEATTDPLPALQRGDLDLALCHSMPSRPDDWVIETLSCDPFVLLVAADHPLAARAEVQTRDLLDETLLVFELPRPYLRRLSAELFPDGRLPRRVQRVPLTEAIVQLVRSRQGVSIISSWVAEGYRDRPDLAILPFAEGGPERRWKAVYSPTSPAREVIASIVRLLRQTGAFGDPA